MDGVKVMRNMVSVVDEKRKNHKFALSDQEFSQINKVSEEMGFKKPRDLLVYLCCGKLSIVETIAENERAHLAISLCPLATVANKIESGIDVENSQRQLIEEVEKLCHIYKL